MIHSLLAEPGTKKSIRIALLGLLVSAASPAQSQTVQDDRQFEHLLISAHNFADFSGGQAPVTQLFAFAFRSGAWAQIPFQIDERAGGSFFELDDGLLDDDDQILFMAHDAGEQVPPTNWIADNSSLAFPRYEIRVTDPLTSREAFVYLYRSTTLAPDPTVETYMRYVPVPAGLIAADTVYGRSYRQGHHNLNGLPEFLAVPASFGGTGTDFLDRLKLRIQARPLFLTLNLNEQDNMRTVAGSVRARSGKVRVIREMREDVIVSGSVLATVELMLFFYPFSQQLSGQLPLTSQLAIRKLRASFDFAPNVAPSAWHNQNFGPRTITGASGGLTPAQAQIVLLPRRNWFSMISPHGSFTGIFAMEAISGATQQFYFWDSQSGSADDTGADTGDGRSYGDSGFLISSGSNIVATFQLAMSTFITGPNWTGAQAASLNANAENPMSVNFNRQDFVVPVELAAYTVTVTRNQAALEWITASETNNLGFHIERSERQNNWQEIGFVKGNGTTTQAQRYSFTDANLRAGAYRYRLRQVDFDGTFEFSPVRDAIVSVPQRFVLAQNFPNPVRLSNAGTVIRYELPNAEPARVELRVFNLLGHEVHKLVEAQQPGGYYEVRWDGRFGNGELAPAGIYFYELRTGGHREMKKLTLVR